MSTNTSLWLSMSTFLRNSENHPVLCLTVLPGSNKNSVCLYLLPDLHHSLPEILGFNPVAVFTHLGLNNVFHHKHLLQNCPIYHLQNQSLSSFWVTNNSSIFPSLLQQKITFFILMNSALVTKFTRGEI